MVNRIVLALLLVAVALKSASPQQTVLVVNGMGKAQDFLELSENSKKAFAMGFIDGIYVAPYLGAPDKGEVLVSLQKCVAGMSNTQLGAIIEKYIKEHPENWHRPLNTEAWTGVMEACALEKPVLIPPK
jgi:hypothetical protein